MPKPLHNADYKRLLKLVKEAREEAGMTQKDLAPLLDEDQSYVSKCERGVRRLDVIELRNWVQALGLSFSAFADLLDSDLQKTSAISRHTVQKRKSR